jgi:hypothetical protein
MPLCFSSFNSNDNYLCVGDFGTDISEIFNPLSTNVIYIYTVYIYIYLELLVKPEILTSYVYEPAFGNAESRLFLFAAQCFNIESTQNIFLCHSCV